MMLFLFILPYLLVIRIVEWKYKWISVELWKLWNDWLLSGIINRIEIIVEKNSNCNRIFENLLMTSLRLFYYYHDILNSYTL